MIIMPTSFSFLFRNVNSSHALASFILEEHAHTDIDIIFFQELTQKQIRVTAHIDIPDSEPVIGLPIHPAWTCLPPPSPISQVAIYVHQRIFSRYHFTVDGQIFGHLNIFVMFCYDPTLHVKYAYINVYANPNRNCADMLKDTIHTLLSLLHRIAMVQLIQGDFNLHCSYWDEETHDNPSLAWSLIRGLHECQLSLVNDESIPTFYHQHNQPQVLDLIWVNDNVFSWHGAQVVYDITGPNTDHKTLMLRVGAQADMHLQNDHIVRRYIPLGSEEEEHFIFFLFQQ